MVRWAWAIPRELSRAPGTISFGIGIGLGDRLVKGSEEVVATAPFPRLGALPIRVVVIALAQETLRVGHQSKDATAFVLEGGDAPEAAVHVIGIDQGRGPVLHVGLGFLGRLRDEPALGVGDGKLEFLGQIRQEGTVRGELLQANPLALEAPAGVLDEAAGGEQAELGENLETVADPQQVTALVAELLEGVADLLLGDEAGN